MKQNDFFIGTQPKNNYNFFKRFSIMAMLLLPLLNIQSQTTTTVLENYDGTNLTAVAPTYTSGAFSVVANPSSTGNTSAHVAKYIRNSNEGYDRLFLNIGTSIPDAKPFTKNYYKISFDVYTTASTATPIPLVMDLTNGATYTTAWPAGLHSEYRTAITKTGEWQTITFAYESTFGQNAALSTQIDQLSLMFNGGTNTNDTYYIDNIKIEKQPLNLASDKTALASTGDATAAVDGNQNSRWSGDQWVSVDLGATYDITRLVLSWEGAYGESYEIHISDDPTFPANKTTIIPYNNPAGLFPAGPFPLINNLGTGSTALGTGRYIKMLGITAGTPYGFSIYEFEVYGNLPGSLGINDVEEGQTPTVSLYPNPAEDYVTLSFPESLSNKVVTIYDLLGKSLIQSKVDDAAQESIININQLSKGTYIVNIKTDGKSWSKKLIKQ